MKQFSNLTISKQTFSNLFVMLVVALMVMPLVTTFSEFLTRIVENTFLYLPIQKFIVPYEIDLVRAILSIFRVETIDGAGIFQVVIDGIPQGIRISWNCVGWQSFVILLVSLKTGLGGQFSKASIIEAVLIGLIGTFLINILRISAVILIYYFFGRMPAIILHDFGSILLTIIWLFVFWWFTYTFVLEGKYELRTK